MINSKRLLVDSVRRYCERRHIELLSHSHDWILQLRTPRCSHLIYGYDLGANSATAAKVANDKSATYDVLAANGIRAIEHRVFLHPRLLDFVASEGNWRAMLHAFEAFGRNAVIKDNEGTGGMEVFRVRTVKELEQQVHGLFQIARAIALSPYRTIEAECRYVMLEGDCLLAYRKQRPAVTGNGEHSVRQLIAAAHVEGRLGIPLTAIDNPDLLLDRIPPAGERAVLQWRHNLGRGATPVALDPAGADQAAAVALARTAMDTLGLKFAAIDVATIAGLPEVIEVNSGVMLEVASRTHAAGADLADHIYHRVLDGILR